MIRSGSYVAVLTAFAASAALALATTPVARSLAMRLGVVDRPGPRKIHQQTTPYLGGAVVVLTVLVLSGALARGGAVDRRIPGALALAMAVGAMGLVDDLRPVPGWVKFLVITPSALAMWVMGVRASVFGSPVPDLILTVGWVAGVTNAVNFLDNMDGAAAGVSAVAAAGLATLCALSGQAGLAIVAASLAGACLGFLHYNRSPARIFMGDLGSGFIGSLLASLGLLMRTPALDRFDLLAALAVLSVPVLDTLVITVSRVGRRLSPLRAGTDHVSHRLTALGLSRRGAVRTLWLAGVVASVSGVAMGVLRGTAGLVLVVTHAAVAGALGVLMLRTRFPQANEA